MENNSKEEKQQNDKEKLQINEMRALNFYQIWVKDGKHVGDNGYNELGENGLISITNVCLWGLMQVAQRTVRGPNI